MPQARGDFFHRGPVRKHLRGDQVSKMFDRHALACETHAGAGHQLQETLLRELFPVSCKEQARRIWIVLAQEACPSERGTVGVRPAICGVKSAS